MSFFSIPDGGNWGFVEKITIAGAAVQDQDFATTLDGNVDEQYVMDIYLVNDDASTALYNPRINGASWAINKQILNGVGTSATANRNTDIFIATVLSTVSIQLKVEFTKAETGNTRNALATEQQGENGGIGLLFSRCFITTPSAATNITSLGIHSDVADGIGIGSIFRLWRKI